MPLTDRLRDRAPRLHRFLTRNDGPWPFVRDLAGVAAVGFVLFLVLVTATGQFFHGPPVVVVESGSMMHCANGIDMGHHGRACEAERYGRIGTIDAGDLIFVRDTDGRGGIRTFAQGGESRYGEAGDTMVYHADPSGLRVIHRAMFWLQVNGDGTFTIPELGLANITDLSVASVLGDAREAYRVGDGCIQVASAHGLTPDASGFITKGDNNPCFDQSGQGFGYAPVRPSQILGKARGEIPWIGLSKLWLFDLLHGSTNYANAPSDVRVMMWVSLATLVGAPLAVDAVVKRRRARQAGPADESPEGPPEEPGPPADGPAAEGGGADGPEEAPPRRGG